MDMYKTATPDEIEKERVRRLKALVPNIDPEALRDSIENKVIYIYENVNSPSTHALHGYIYEKEVQKQLDYVTRKENGVPYWVMVNPGSNGTIQVIVLYVSNCKDYWGAEDNPVNEEMIGCRMKVEH